MQEARNPKPASILLVDGDSSSRRVLRTSLRNVGFSVVSVGSAHSARKELLRSAPDLILSDTFLAQGDGYALCTWVKTTPLLEQTPFVFITSNTSDDARQQAMDAGCDDYLVKPLFFHRIVARLQALVERRKLSLPDHQGGMSGPLSQFSVVDLVQLMELRQRTGVVSLLDGAGESGTLRFRAGQLIDAEMGGLTGEEAAFQLFPWCEGSFQLSWEDVDQPVRIERPNAALIFDWIGREEPPRYEEEDDSASLRDWFAVRDDTADIELHRQEDAEPELAGASLEALAARAGLIEVPVAPVRQSTGLQARKVEVEEGYLESLGPRRRFPPSSVALSSGSWPRVPTSARAPAPVTSLEPPASRTWRWSVGLLLALGLAVGLGLSLHQADPLEHQGTTKPTSLKGAAAPEEEQAPETSVPVEPISAADAQAAESARHPPSTIPKQPAAMDDVISDPMVLRVKAQILANVEGGKDLQDLVQKHANRWLIFSQLALSELSQGRIDQAMILAESVLQVHEEAPEAHLVVAAVAHQRRHVRRARQAYERYLVLCPQCAYAREVRSILSQLGN